MDLSAIRTAAGLSQLELGKRLGVTDTSAQTYVSRRERGTDWLLSTVLEYLVACGAGATLTVEIAGETLVYLLDQDSQKLLLQNT